MEAKTIAREGKLMTKRMAAGLANKLNRNGVPAEKRRMQGGYVVDAMDFYKDEAGAVHICALRITDEEGW